MKVRRFSIALLAAILGMGSLTILGSAKNGEELSSNSQKAEAEKSSTNPQTTAIIGGTIIDGTGHPPMEGGIILIQGNKILAVGKKDQIAFPKDVHEINAAGKYILPGLMDANVHFVISNGRSIEFMARYEGHFEDLIEEAAQVTLRNGVTTVFETWGPLLPLMKVRDRINQGKTIGSRMYVAGNIIGLTGPFGSDFNQDALNAATTAFVNRINSMWEQKMGPNLGYMTPDQLRLAIRDYISRGADFLKYGSSGHGSDNSRFIVFSLEAQKAIVEECHKAGLTVQAHTTTNESLRLAIEAGVDLITHAGVTGDISLAESTMSALIEKRIPCGIIPKTNRRYQMEMGSGIETRLAPLDRHRLEIWRDNQLRLVKAGISVLLNTDGGLWSPDYIAQYKPEHWVDYGAFIGEGYFIRAKAMADLGLSPMEIILAGTRNVASAYNKLDQLGTLEKGKLADLVILDNNPLEDIQNLRSIFLVIKDGQVIDRNKLPLNKILYSDSVKTILDNKY